MRYSNSSYSSSNKRQYWIALGKRDLELLLEEALNASRYAATAMSDEDRHRLKGIVAGLQDALRDAEKLGDDGGRRGLLKQKQGEK